MFIKSVQNHKINAIFRVVKVTCNVPQYTTDYTSDYSEVKEVTIVSFQKNK